MSPSRTPHQGELSSQQGDNNPQDNLAENLAFIVNIPLALEFKNQDKTHLDFEATLNKIRAIQNAYLQGYTPETCPPFKMIFCVNSHTTQIESLNTFKQQWDLAKTNNGLWKEASETSVITQAWSGGKFPYGQIRNGLLHSKETQDEIKLFQEKGFYPYVAIGDSDTGNRLVEVNGEIKHIFAAIQQRLNKKFNSPPSESSSPEEIKQHTDSPRVSMSISVKKADLSEGEITPPNNLFIRPYLIAGGYRPISTETHQETRTRSIQRDMHIREQLANTVNPLGPYFPEPNLFLDAKIADKVNFGKGSGEFLQLRKEVSQLIMQDMLNGKPINISNEEWAAQVQSNIQNNRHPERNTAIATFFDLAIETNTDRLFRKVEQMTEQINNNLVAQHHQNAVNAKPAFLLNRYDSDRNGKDIFTKIRDFIGENKGNMSKTIEFYHELIYSQKQEQPEHKGDLLDQSYEQFRTKDNRILELTQGLIKESKNITVLQEGHSNRSAAEFTTPEHTALDILNTATATVYGKDINTLLKEHWQNELQYFNETYKQQDVTATSGNQHNVQIAASRQIINPEVLIETHRQLDNIGRINSQATWKTLSNLVTKVNDQQTTSTSEFIYKCGLNSSKN